MEGIDHGNYFGGFPGLELWIYREGEHFIRKSLRDRHGRCCPSPAFIGCLTVYWDRVMNPGMDVMRF